MAHAPTTRSASSPPSLETIARLVEQSIEEQRETRQRLDTHLDISSMRFSSLEKAVDALRDTMTAQYLTITGQLADTRKRIDRIEEHVGFLTTKVLEHDKRFDAIDERLDAIDERLDGIDERLAAHDRRFDAIDARFDAVDAQLETIIGGIDGLRQAIAPPS